MYATGKAEDLKLSKVSVETVFYSWLVQDLPDKEKKTFLKTLDALYMRSKKESRAGFPHVNEMLEKK